MENKTAMQILIGDLKSIGIQFNPEMYLSMEKKQVMTAFFDGANHIVSGGEFGFEGNESTAKTYYETTYQNTAK